MKETLLLKFGTLKAWHLEKERTIALIKKYGALGYSLSCMLQKDTHEQKQILCELIEALEGTIQSDWSGEFLTKEQAKKYIMTGEE